MKYIQKTLATLPDYRQACTLYKLKEEVEFNETIFRTFVDLHH